MYENVELRVVLPFRLCFDLTELGEEECSRAFQRRRSKNLFWFVATSGSIFTTYHGNGTIAA